MWNTHNNLRHFKGIKIQFPFSKTSIIEGCRHADRKWWFSMSLPKCYMTFVMQWISNRMKYFSWVPCVCVCKFTYSVWLINIPSIYHYSVRLCVCMLNVCGIKESSQKWGVKWKIYMKMFDNPRCSVLFTHLLSCTYIVPSVR